MGDHMEGFVPFHINAQESDFEGNGGCGRYVLLPGSEDGLRRSRSMWKDVSEKHPRNHNLYLGRMESEAGTSTWPWFPPAWAHRAQT